MLVQQYRSIDLPFHICWYMTMCARVDTGKEKQDKGIGKHNITIYSLMTRIICHVYHSEYTWTEIFYVPIRLQHVDLPRENKEHNINSNGRSNRKLLKFNHELIVS